MSEQARKKSLETSSEATTTGHDVPKSILPGISSKVNGNVLTITASVDLSTWYPDLFGGRAKTVPNDGADRLVSAKEAAEMFAVDVRTIRRWKNAGALAPVNKPGHLRFRRQDLERLMQTREQRAST